MIQAVNRELNTYVGKVPAVHIDIIDTLPSLAKLENNWNAVYDADPEAQIFLSWKWLSGWLADFKGPWFILAAKAGDSADAPYVAFFPVRLQTTIETADVVSEMTMAGNSSADYTGIVCAPDAESKVIPAFARHIKQMHWGHFNLEKVRMSERRFRLLLAYFPKANFHLTELNRVDKVDDIDYTLGDRIDSRSIPDVLEQAAGLHQKGQIVEAECGYRRILQVEPKHADALHRLGELLAAKGNYAEAKPLFRTLTVVRPDAVKAWLCLAQACENLGQHREAVQPYLEAMRLRPDQADGFAGLSRVLVKLGRIEDINNALLSTLGCTAKPSVRKWRASDRPPAGLHKMPEARQLSW